MTTGGGPSGYGLFSQLGAPLAISHIKEPGNGRDPHAFLALGCAVQGLRLWVQGFGCRVQGS